SRLPRALQPKSPDRAYRLEHIAQPSCATPNPRKAFEPKLARAPQLPRQGNQRSFRPTMREYSLLLGDTVPATGQDASLFAPQLAPYRDHSVEALSLPVSMRMRLDAPE